MRFLSAVLLVFVGIFALIALLDYIELMRRASDIPHVSALLGGQDLVLPRAAGDRADHAVLRADRRHVLLSRICRGGWNWWSRRSAGMSAWQFIAPALVVAFLLGVVATTIYNPVSAYLQERSKRYEAELFGQNAGRRSSGGSFWTSQRSSEGQAIINAKSSRDQGVNAQRRDRCSPSTMPAISSSASRRARRCWSPACGGCSTPASTNWACCRWTHRVYRLKTSLTPEQVRESFATPETVPFWELPLYIKIAEHAGLGAAGYRLQFQKLLARPFLLVAMVFLAAAVSLRFFRFGGVQKMVLSGVALGFLLYVLSKVTEDLSKAELMHPVAAAWLPVLAGGLTGFIALLYQEDG